MLDKYDARVENVGSDKKAVTSVTDINLWLNDMQIESVKNFAEICLQRTHDAVLPYYENEYVQMIGIPLNGDPSCHLFIMLPKEANRLEHCENFMTGKKLLKLLGSMWYHKVEVSIPKFNISDQHDLNEKLEHLQVPEMMGDEKYLQKISNEPFISLLTLHCVRLSFRGSEMEDQQEDEVEVVDDAPPLSFVADRPFLYLITKNLTLVLIGRLEP
ncbi:Serpin I2 [Toxocara canis]|nr:Serpin I2 [Toxocara canis]